jgi:phage gp29-like protein
MQAPAPTNTTLLNPAEAWWAVHSPRDERSAITLLQTEAAGGRHQRSVYELFAEMTAKDGHLYAVLQTRLNGLLGLQRRITPGASADTRALQSADFINHALDRIPRLAELLRSLLDGIAKGFAVVELVWNYDPDGHLLITDWIAHPQEWFAFSPSGELLLLSPPFRDPGTVPADPVYASIPSRATFPAREAFPAPPRKFIVLRFGADLRNPYGLGLCQHAYWYYWFKKNTLKFWAIFNERYGSPAAIATYKPGTTPEDRRRLRDILEALQTDSSIIIPESVELKLLEQARGGNAQSYREFLDWCNDEISKIVLGATLTAGEGRRSGSLALGSVHQLVRQDYIDADARLLEEVLNESLVRWLCELNLGAAAPRPRLLIETESPEDLQARMAVDKNLLGLGVSLPLSYFYTQYGRPAPTPGEQPLRYDDANFYQYHLQFGVLTINEVRKRLGLGPVPWGDNRTATPDTEIPGVRGSAEDRGTMPR